MGWPLGPEGTALGGREVTMADMSLVIWAGRLDQREQHLVKEK